MRLDATDTARVTRCLWLLQENVPNIDGLMLVSKDGLTLTSTLDGSASAQRLGAVCATLFWLCDLVSSDIGSGAAVEVDIELVEPGHNAQENIQREVSSRLRLRPVLHDVMLTAIYQPSAVDGEVEIASLDAALDQTAHTLAEIITNASLD